MLPRENSDPLTASAMKVHFIAFSKEQRHILATPKLRISQKVSGNILEYGIQAIQRNNNNDRHDPSEGTEYFPRDHSRTTSPS